METINTWWSSLQATDQIYWGIALLSSVFFLLQTAATLTGICYADDMGVDAPDDSSIGSADGAMDLFTVRNMVNFLLGFGWSGVCLRSVISSTGLLAAVSLVIGICFVAIFMFVFRQLMRLEMHGNVDFRDAVGTVQSVYLHIPEAMSGRGKVQVSINGSVFEVDAMTHGDAIPTGAKVEITGMKGNSAFIVKHI